MKEIDRRKLSTHIWFVNSETKPSKTSTVSFTSTDDQASTK